MRAGWTVAIAIYKLETDQVRNAVFPDSGRADITN